MGPPVALGAREGGIVAAVAPAVAEGLGFADAVGVAPGLGFALAEEWGNLSAVEPPAVEQAAVKAASAQRRRRRRITDSTVQAPASFQRAFAPAEKA